MIGAPPLLIEGGTGTELERMGATMHSNAWSARAVWIGFSAEQQASGTLTFHGSTVFFADGVPSVLWNGPRFAYPHHRAGAVGGCCGIGPAHIADLRQKLDQITSI
ncbi:MAG: homocysteine S-methyltransferase family protein [Alkalispirochaeta sp.]